GSVDGWGRPGGIASGVMASGVTLGGIWLELVREIAPAVMRAAVFGDRAIPTGTGMFGAIQSVAPVLGIEAIPLNVRDADQIKRALSAFARPGNGGLIVTPRSLSFLHRDLMIAPAAEYKLPPLYFFRPVATAVGLTSYVPE